MLYVIQIVGVETSVSGNGVLFCGQSEKVWVKTATNHCTFLESQKTQQLDRVPCT